jgi:TetR/AcrR family transcriptional repressor of nem operon
MRMPRARQFDTGKALDQALHAFWRGGYEATSVQDLCAAMDIRPASLYAAFGDKRALYVAALEAYMLRSQAQFAETAEAAGGGLAGVRAVFARLIERLCGEDGRSGCLVTNTAAERARHDAELARMVELHWARLGAIFSNALAEARARDELQPGAGPETAAMLVCLAQGLNVMAKTRPPRAQLQAVVDLALGPLERARLG